MRIRTHTNPFTITKRFAKIKPDQIFPNYSGKLDLEIGFGSGLFLQNYAKNNLERCIVGVEVRKKTIEFVEKILAKEKIENVNLVYGNGFICLQDMFDDFSIDNIFIFHPDPWLKRRHQNRRVINEGFLNVAKVKLKKLGKIFVSTDVESLWNNILKTFETNKNYVFAQNDDFWQNFYLTRWTEMSEEKNRNIYFGVFQLK